MSTSQVRIPPDSTGKRIRHNELYDIELSSVDSAELAIVNYGDTLNASPSSATAIFTGFHVEHSTTNIYLEEITGTLAVGDTLTHNGNSIGVVNSITTRYAPKTILSDPYIPDHMQRVDHYGNAYTRFEDGSVLFDAFGNARYSESIKVAQHIFIYGDNASKYYDETISGATVAPVYTDSSLKLEVTDQINSRITRTSNQYYPYNPGVGTEIMMSLRSGDNGKTGVIRRWGLFDDDDGVFFQLSGTAFQVVNRNSATGSIVDTIVEREDFNGDPLQDSTIHSYAIDFSKYNLFWIDFQWLGVGRVRFGTFAPDGRKVIIHTIENPNQHTVPYMKRGTLPFRIEMFNESNTASSSEMKLICADITRQNNNAKYEGITHDHDSDDIVSLNSTGYTPIISFRPLQTFNGLTNRTTVIPIDFEIFSDNEAIEIEIVLNPTLSGVSWSQHHPYSSTEVDESATSYTGGTRFATFFAPAGISLRELEEDLRYAITLNADGVTQPIFTVAGRVLKPGASADVQLVVRWREVR